MNLKLGILGLSDSNGHPYSWSAIFNGYDPVTMELCGFPVIPRYLEKKKWPESRIQGAEVVAVWTQDEELSQKVAKAAKIPKVVSKPEDMIGEVDAVLLARDDAENHLKFAASFLRAGIPIYIDKPVALSVQSLEQIYSLEQYPGQIFTCSALRFSTELKLKDDDRSHLGEIRQIVAFTPKSWNKYAVHVIEPVLNMLPEGDFAESYTRLEGVADGSSSSLSVSWHSGIQTTFFATGEGVSPISIRVIGTKGWRELTFTDSFSAFKKALNTFVIGIKNRAVLSPREFNAKVVKILEKGKP